MDERESSRGWVGRRVSSSLVQIPCLVTPHSELQLEERVSFLFWSKSFKLKCWEAKKSNRKLNSTRKKFEIREGERGRGRNSREWRGIRNPSIRTWNRTLSCDTVILVLYTPPPLHPSPLLSHSHTLSLSLVLSPPFLASSSPSNNVTISCVCVFYQMKKEVSQYFSFSLSCFLLNFFQKFLFCFSSLSLPFQLIWFH